MQQKETQTAQYWQQRRPQQGQERFPLSAAYRTWLGCAETTLTQPQGWYCCCCFPLRI
jgi:hypothetical protein